MTPEGFKMTPELITAILGAGGLAAILPKVIDGLKAWYSGRAVDEKEKNQGLVQRLAEAEKKTDEAEARLEDEIRTRQNMSEYAATLRRTMIDEYGVPANKLPPWPIRKK